MRLKRSTPFLLEQELSKINQKVVQSHKPFEKIQRELERMKDILMFDLLLIGCATKNIRSVEKLD